MDYDFDSPSLKEGERGTLRAAAGRQALRIKEAFPLVKVIDPKLIDDMATTNSEPVFGIYCGLLCESAGAHWPDIIDKSAKLQNYKDVAIQGKEAAIISEGEIKGLIGYRTTDVNRIRHMTQHGPVTEEVLAMLIEFRANVFHGFYLMELRDQAFRIMGRPSTTMVNPLAAKETTVPEAEGTDTQTDEKVSDEEMSAADETLQTNAGAELDNEQDPVNLHPTSPLVIQRGESSSTVN